MSIIVSFRAESYNDLASGDFVSVVLPVLGYEDRSRSTPLAAIPGCAPGFGR